MRHTGLSSCASRKQQHFFFLKNNMVRKDFISHFVCVYICVEKEKEFAHQNINSGRIEVIFTFLNV